MPKDIIKGSFKYVTGDRYFLVVFILMFLLAIVSNFEDSFGILSFIISVFITGYGLQVLKDVIDGGTRLPKIMPKKVIVLGLKGTIVFIFYLLVQSLILIVISTFFDFPEFDIGDLLLNFPEIIDLIYSQDPVSFTVFFILGCIVVYISTFFMEIALAQLADGGNLKNAFNFPKIKHAIDVIGWRNFALDYSKIIFSLIIITAVDNAIDSYWLVEDVLQIFFFMWMFIIEFGGMGIIFKRYTDKKLQNSQTINN